MNGSTLKKKSFFCVYRGGGANSFLTQGLKTVGSWFQSQVGVTYQDNVIAENTTRYRGESSLVTSARCRLTRIIVHCMLLIFPIVW